MLSLTVQLYLDASPIDVKVEHLDKGMLFTLIMICWYMLIRKGLFLPLESGVVADR